jgi:hypothetical protein
VGCQPVGLGRLAFFAGGPGFWQLLSSIAARVATSFGVDSSNDNAHDSHLQNIHIIMLIPFLIMLREGMEAALIVGIIASYLRQSGQQRWMPAVWLGVVLACLLSLGVGLALEMTEQEFPQKQQELFEAVVALIAVGILTSMVFWMKQAARSIKGQLQDSIDAALSRGRGQAYALVGMAFLPWRAKGWSRCSSCWRRFSSRQQPAGLAGGLAGAGWWPWPWAGVFTRAGCALICAVSSA